jgi:hypothetical protein
MVHECIRLPDSLGKRRPVAPNISNAPRIISNGQCSIWGSCRRKAGACEGQVRSILTHHNSIATCISLCDRHSCICIGRRERGRTALCIPERVWMRSSLEGRESLIARLGQGGVRGNWENVFVPLPPLNDLLLPRISRPLHHPCLELKTVDSKAPLPTSNGRDQWCE